MNDPLTHGTRLPNSRNHGEHRAPMEASEAVDGLPNADGRKPEASPQPSAEAERAMRDALMGCYNG